ncbi:MAG: PhzF family phenazine biosynthesis isomerase, partial [Actinomycetota bacterium]|nr:PhzF family phenazine biosynthesis isomerase [Actinomycetota bacterium]
MFTDRRFTGNQLAVFPDGGSVPEGLRQDIAREIGFSETVFVDPPSHPTAGDARIRIFTPAVELPFAGHPVLGTAVALGVE